MLPGPAASSSRQTSPHQGQPPVWCQHPRTLPFAQAQTPCSRPAPSPATRERIKKPRALDLATLECKTRGRRRVDPFSGAGGWGAAGTRGGPCWGRAPGRGRWDESSTQGPGQRGSHPLGYPSGAGAEDGAHLEPRKGWKDSHLARDGGGLGTKRASVGSCGARAPLGPARGGREGTRS